MDKKMMKPMMKGMKSLAKKSGAVEAKINENNVYYPNMSLDMNALSELQNCDVGDEGMILCHYKVTGKNEYNNGDKTCMLDIVAADIVEEAEAKDEGKDAGAEENK